MEENKFGYLYVLEFSYPAIYEIELTEEDQKLTSDEILEKIKEHFCVDNVTDKTIEYVIEEIVSTYYI